MAQAFSWLHTSIDKLAQHQMIWAKYLHQTPNKSNAVCTCRGCGCMTAHEKLIKEADVPFCRRLVH